MCNLQHPKQDDLLQNYMALSAISEDEQCCRPTYSTLGKRIGVGVFMVLSVLGVSGFVGMAIWIIWHVCTFGY